MLTIKLCAGYVKLCQGSCCRIKCTYFQVWAFSRTWMTSWCYRFCSSLMPGHLRYAQQSAKRCTAFVCMTSSGEPLPCRQACSVFPGFHPA